MVGGVGQVPGRHRTRKDGITGVDGRYGTQRRNSEKRQRFRALEKETYPAISKKEDVRKGTRSHELTLWWRGREWKESVSTVRRGRP